MIVEIVGILNITPDSFSDGGDYIDPVKALARAKEMFNEGASFVDVGAESTNPWSKPLEPTEEWRRLEAVLPSLLALAPGKVSVDTYHPVVARKALDMGATIINDVTMFHDKEMVNLAAEHGKRARYILSHLSPTAHTISEAHKLMPTTSIHEVKSELLAKRQELLSRGIPSSSIILDPGIGFGKTNADNWRLNWALLKFAKEVPGIDVMIGYSRKRFLGDQRMTIKPNIEAAKIAIKSGARYLRVHDVAAHIGLLKRMGLAS